MEDTANHADQSSLLMDLLPVGTVLAYDRVITNSNSLFAQIFGYTPEDLLGKSLEVLYPSYREYVDRGDEWHGFMSRNGEHCDERVMLSKGDNPVWVRVKGRCKDPKNPYMLVACTFELALPVFVNDIRLTPRERTIIEAMSNGLTSKQMAQKLGLSYRSIETYRARLMAKTGARNATQLLALTR
jgi:PAS domain S-box-containing protein